MSLSPGSRLGSYEISARIGAGGMGEVYRALDSTLGRQVALKVLPDAFASDPDRLARFEREAKTLAAVNHLNIAQIYGFEEVNGVRALVMELVEGETLADRSARAPIPLDDTVVIGRQIAEALEAAHEQGIIHRDLKPANIKLRPDGVVKVLDFGLAKALGSDAVEPDMTYSPTLSLGVTSAGVILGTAAYMSPEQASGQQVDRRTDIWSFGAVLYEMLVGRKAFPGQSMSDTLAAVLKVDPDWEALPAETPSSIRQLIRRCLTRDRGQRLQAIGEARIVLENPGRSPSTVPAARQPRAGLLASFAAAVFAIAFATTAFVHFREQPAMAVPVQRFEMPMPRPEMTSAIVSPDGMQLAFWLGGRGGPRTNQPLLVRRLDSLETRPLPGTEESIGLPFWSSDSRYIAFSSTDRKIKKIDVTTGAMQVLGEARATIGGFWTDDDTIVFSDAGRLVQIPASGGTAVPLPGFSERDVEDRVPLLLPDRRHFLFNRISQDGIGTYVASRDDGAAKPTKLMDGIVQAFAPATGDPDSGYVAFLANVTAASDGLPIGTLMAQRLDLRKLALTGTPVLISERTGLASASRTGILILTRAARETGDQLTIFDRQGTVVQTLGEPDEYSRVSFSPDDGSRVIATRGGGRGSVRQLWIFDLARGLWSRLPTDPGVNVSFPVWSPDGIRIVFASGRGSERNRNLYQRLSNGGGDDELLLKADEDLVPLSWSRNGRFLGVGAGSAALLTHFVLTLDDKGKAVGKPTVFVRRGMGLGIEFSPDGDGPPRWVAYEANRAQRTEIYLREFDPNSPTLTPASAGEYQVSNGGGTSPRWSPNGKELFYLAPDRTVMKADLTGNAKAPTGRPSVVFKPAGIERASRAGVAVLSWDISPDGKRFLFPIPVAAGMSTPPLTVVVNWTSLLKQ